MSLNPEACTGSRRPKLREERGLSGCRKGLKTVPLAQALLSLKPAAATTTKKEYFNELQRIEVFECKYTHMILYSNIY